MAGDAGPDRFMTLRLSATDIEVRTSLDLAMKALEGWGIAADARGTAEIVLAEVLNNIVEHTYAGMEPGPIWIGLLLTGGGAMSPRMLAVTVGDMGRPLPRGVIVDPECPVPDPAHLSVSDLPEGGFGWAIIRNLAHDLRAGRSGGVNHLSFRLSVVSADK